MLPENSEFQSNMGKVAFANNSYDHPFLVIAKIFHFVFKFLTVSVHPASNLTTNKTSANTNVPMFNPTLLSIVFLMFQAVLLFAALLSMQRFATIFKSRISSLS